MMHWLTSLLFLDQCPRCELGFTKSEACNKMTCPRDGYKMCEWMCPLRSTPWVARLTFVSSCLSTRLHLPCQSRGGRLLSLLPTVSPFVPFRMLSLSCNILMLADLLIIQFPLPTYIYIPLILALLTSLIDPRPSPTFFQRSATARNARSATSTCRPTTTLTSRRLASALEQSGTASRVAQAERAETAGRETCASDRGHHERSVSPLSSSFRMGESIARRNADRLPRAPHPGIDRLRTQTEAQVASDLRSLALRTAKLAYSEDGVAEWASLRLWFEGMLWFLPGLVRFLFSLDWA